MIENDICKGSLNVTRRNVLNDYGATFDNGNASNRVISWLSMVAVIVSLIFNARDNQRVHSILVSLRMIRTNDVTSGRPVQYNLARVNEKLIGHIYLPNLPKMVARSEGEVSSIVESPSSSVNIAGPSPTGAKPLS
jgi:hypothetical protein